MGSVTWTDRQGVYLGQGPTLPQQLSGTQIVCHVKLGEALGRQYQNPADTLYAVVQGSTLRIPLSPLTSITLTGTVTAESTGKTIRGATVTVSQMLNGSYPVTQSTKTDINGHYELTVYGSVGGDLQSPTTITISHSDYLKASVCPTVLPSDDVLDFSLKDITGTIVDLDLSYTAAVADGEESVTEEGYSNPDNIAYTVYDETHGQELTDISSQYPILVLLGDELAEGTRLRITATSITGDFMPVTTTCTVDNNARATAIFGIKEMGQLKASFEMTDNMSVMGVLYDSEGQQVGWAPYKNTELTATHLKDGNYTLVTMSYSELFTSVSSLDNLLSLEGMDDQQIVMNEVTIRSAHITEVKNHNIPLLDEDRFRYTSDATTVSVNKTEVTVGSYVTVRAELAFKPAYVDALSKVRLQFDMPEGCEFVENSMMVGNRTAAYEVDDRRITVLIEDLNDAVRFCVVPTQGGTFEVAAGTRFHLNGATKIQPIGAVTFSAEDLTINVPATTGRRLLPVTGMAVPLSQVEVFDGGVSIGQTTAIGTGYFSVICPLDNPYNLSEHSIYAIITTPEGIQMQSETKTVKIDRGTFTPVVTLRLKGLNHEHNTDDFVFDFRTNTVTPGGMNMRYADSNFEVSLFVDFYDQNDMLVNDTTVIRDVKLHILRESRDVLSVDAPYSERHKRWEYILGQASDYTVGHNLPINVDVEYTNVLENPVFDRQEFDDRMQEYVDFFEEGRQHMRDVYHMFDDNGQYPDKPLVEELGILLEQDSLDASGQQRVNELVERLVGDSIMNEARKKYEYDYTEINELFAKEELTEEENDRLHDLITARAEALAALPIQEINVDSIDAIYQKLDNTLAAIYEEVRDSMFLASAMFYGPDTTTVALPSGDVLMTFQTPDGRYEKVEITVLTSINHEQLIAEGYTTIPTIDGVPFYYLQKENGYCLIDAKTLKRYSLSLVDEQEVSAIRRAEDNWWAALMNLSISVFFPKHCGDQLDDLQRHFVKAAAQLKQSTDFISFLENLTTNAVPILKDAEGILKCVYDNGIFKFDEFIKKVFDSAKKKADDALKTAEEQLKGIQNEMADLTARKAEAERSIKSLDMDDDLQRAIKNRHQPGSPQWLKADNKIKANEFLRKGHNSHIKDLNKALKGLKAPLDKALGLVNKAKGGIEKCLNNQKWILGLLEKFPIKLVPDKNVLKTIPKPLFAMPLAGTLLKCFPVCCVAADNLMDSGLWLELHRAIESIMPCEGDAAKAAKLQADKNSKMMLHIGINFAQMGIDLASLFMETAATFSPMWFVAKTMDIASCVIAVFHPEASQKDRTALEKRLWELDCTPDKDDDDNTDGGKPGNGTLNNGNNSGSNSHGNGNANSSDSYRKWNFLNIWFVRDPSGYVYEAVNSNRVEGVTTTCYYKETKEDMYGDFHDEAVLWDAETYAQENPLFTDAEGRYQWDVPTGLWQVKYEKQGYETTFSDWLPVPPPQLEVNVGITQFKQPNVANVKAYTNGIDITFDKYMRPNTLKTENIFVTKGGQAISGKIELLNAESGYQTPDSVYASKVRFVANDNLNVNDKIQLTIKKAVESYAGIPMEQDFTQQFTVEQRIEALIADSLVNLAENQEATILVKAVPAAAARGRKVKVTVSDAEVIGLPSLGEGSEVGFDQNGEAKLSVKAEAQGTSVVRFTLTNEELTTTTLITVRNPEQMQVAAPKASRINGTTLYIGSEIRLTCATSGATILYTLDGTCPCDVGSKSVYTYDAPIVLTGDSIHIKAMAVAPGMEDSPVAEYSYKGIQRPDGIEAPTMPDGSPVGTEPVLFFRLNGQRITQPERGITIERSGSQVKKVVRK